MNERIMRAAGFGVAVGRIRDGLCPICEKKIDDYRDEASRKEARISGMCQECQDAVFGGA